VGLSETFVSLECRTYAGREDFIGRLRRTLDAVAAHIRPVLVSRVGVRYTDRLDDPREVEDLPTYVRGALLGMASADLGNGSVRSELTQAEFETDGVSLSGRWGHIPPATSHDASIDPVEVQSWVLDLDAFTSQTTSFSAEDCAREAERYASIVYGFFRWAVSDEFLALHGAIL
jgi:uncharacterized protein (TIGR04255 family)